MKIGLVQSSSEKGAVAKNIENHLRLIHAATDLDADFIVFPELSITGYEPTLAEALAFELDDSRLNVFQDLSNAKEVAIGIGVPTRSSTVINISMIIFRPHEEQTIYSKQILHEDELPYFTNGESRPVFRIKGQKIAIGICYEALQREHILNAVNNKADLYIASVAKPIGGLKKAYAHFPKMTREFNLPILMANCVGQCDDFLSGGQSAIWNSSGELVLQLNENNEGILICNIELEDAKTFQIAK